MWWLIAILKLSFGIVYVKLRHDNLNCQITYKEEILKYTGLSEHRPVLAKERPAVISTVNDGFSIGTKAIVIEVFGLDEISVNEYIHKRCPVVQEVPKIELKRRGLPTYNPNIEVRKIFSSGEPRNRIDVVFMGDGYTLAEKAKFFYDMKNLTLEVFGGSTFKSWLPMLNIWAIFVESLESGVGNGKPKKTAFELYREKDILRGVFTNKPEYANQICQLTGIGACDYPALIANDQLHGGLGGEFVISTLSTRHRGFGLRHEFGHNFADVGEEYDGGYAYRGVNSIDSVGLKWKHWLTGEVREERSVLRISNYSWHKLDSGPKVISFYSDGLYSSYLLSISLTGSAPPSMVNIFLDNVPLNWVGLSNDREFYYWRGKVGFSAGFHNLTITGTSFNTSLIPLMVAYIRLYEFGSPEEFNTDPNHISYYPTWDHNFRKTYRPTNEQCVMRSINSTTLCPICKEGVWSQFLKKLSLIDSLTYESNRLSLKVLLLGHLRPVPVEGETLKITWFHDGIIQPQFNQLLSILNPSSGNWSVIVKLSSLEIRYDPDNATEDSTFKFIRSSLCYKKP